MRLTRLQECGYPYDPLASNSRIQTQKFVMVTSSPQNLDPNEIMLQNACTGIDTYFRTQRRTKYDEWTMQLSWVDLPILEMLLGVSLLAAPADPTEFIGYVRANGLTQPNQDPVMVEVQSENANQAECGAGNGIARHLWPLVRNIAISEDLTVNNSDPFTITLVGDAMNNVNWFPSYPDDTFPSWDPGGGSTASTNIPDGPAPAVIPANIPADPWTLADQADIQAGGPYAMITEDSDAWFDTDSWSCSFVNGGS